MRATKKLLGLLLAVAMVLSMVPAVALPAKAEAVQAETAKGEAVAQNSQTVKDAFAGATGEVTAVCPVCAANGDAAEKTWTAIKADITIKDKASVVAMGGGHFYFAEDLIKDYSYVLGGFFSGSGCLNLNGKTVTLNGGKLVELTAGNTMNIMDTAGGAVVTGSVDQYENNGKTLRVQDDGAVLNLYGGTYQAMNDTYTAYGSDTDHANGSATVAIRGGTLNMYQGATIIGVNGKTGNTSKYGGAVYIHNANNPVFNMYGGTIKDGVATNGGNVCVLQNKAVFNLYGGEILGGTATNGGNVYVHSAGTSSYGTMKMYGGFIASGKATNVNYGNNVYLGTYKSNDVTYCTAVFEMSGGTIVGDVCGGYGTNSNRSVNLSGSAKIVTKAMYNGQQYTGQAGLVRCSFTFPNLGEGSFVWTGQGLAESYGYCDACKAAKKWTTISAPQAMTAGGHYRLKADLAYTYETDEDSSFLSGVGCFDLYGCDLTIDGGRFLLAQTAGTVNIFDSFGGAVVTGSNDYFSEGGLTIRTNAANAVVNLYGGTYKGMEDTATTEGRENANSPLVRMRAGGVLNLHQGATIDGSDLTRTCAAIFMGYSASNPTTFNIEGGTVIGCKNVSNDGIGGVFRVGNAAGDAVLNLRSGVIIGGETRLGDAVCVRPGNTFNMTGGMVIGGENSADTLVYLGKNESAQTGATANISGGVIVGELYAEAYTTVNLSQAPKILATYEAEDGTVYEGTRGLNLKSGATLNIEGLTAAAQIRLSNAADYLNEPFTAAYENAAAVKDAFIMGGNYLVAVNEANQLCVVNPAAGVQLSQDEAVWFDNVSDALAAYDFAKGQVLVLYQDATISGDVYLDIRGDVTVSGTGTVYGIDHSNDSFKSYHVVSFGDGITVAAETVDPIYGSRYIALAEDNGYGFHRINISLTAVTLRTSQAGLYYKAQYACDDVVAGMVDQYGVVLSLQNMPGADFATEQGDINLATSCAAPFTSGAEATSGSVFGIMKEGNKENAARGELKIYANAYIALNNGTVLVADQGEAWSLHDVMNAIDADFADLDAEEQQNVNNFYTQWKEDGMQTWNFENIGS